MNLRIRSTVLALAGALLMTACGGAEVGDAGMAADRIQADRIMDDVRVLAHDSMAGRATGTEAKEMAARYIAGRFQEAGLEPVVDGTYLQPVSLVGMEKDQDASSLTIARNGNALELEPAGNVAYWSTAQEETVEIRDAPLLFVGYGVDAPEYGWDDYKDADVEGKVLLFLNNDPPVTEDGEELFGGEARTYYGRWSYKFEQAMARGAAGALMIHTTPSASYPFSVIQNAGARESWALDIPGTGYQVDMVGWLDRALSEEIAGAMGTDLDGLFEMGKSREFRPVDTGYRVDARIETRLRTAETQNVVGMLPGSDPDLAEQVVVFSAHYDHLGTDGSLEGDTIYNGAWDNASGTAGIVALAEAFAAGERPRRSILFLACGAEEGGILGSGWFVANPPIDRSRLVADFNVDMPQIFGLTSDMAAIGLETNTLGEAFREVASATMVATGEGEVPITVKGDPNPAAGSFYRSDQVNFAKAGIPSLYLQRGTDYVTPPAVDPDEYHEAHYHQPSDEVRDAWDLAGLERDLRVLYRVALRVGNADEMPRWVPGNEFEEEWRELHGME